MCPILRTVSKKLKVHKKTLTAIVFEQSWIFVYILSHLSRNINLIYYPAFPVLKVPLRLDCSNLNSAPSQLRRTTSTRRRRKPCISWPAWSAAMLRIFWKTQWRRRSDKAQVQKLQIFQSFCTRVFDPVGKSSINPLLWSTCAALPSQRHSKTLCASAWARPYPSALSCGSSAHAQ